MSSADQTPSAEPDLPRQRAVVRVLIVDDVEAQRGRLVALLDADPQVEVVGAVVDGAAVRATAALRPDVIVLAAPRATGTHGLETTRRIMREAPTPVVLATASADRDAPLLAEAFDAGVVAVAAVPGPGPTRDSAAQRFIRTVKSMAQVKVVRRGAPLDRRGSSAPAGARVHEVVGIGASTGGPQALQEILSRLPADFPLPVLVVQHTAAGFDSTLVDWLGSQCALPVRLAAAGQRLRRAEISIAPTGWHLVVQHRTVALTRAPPLGGHRPSATMLFQSLAREYGPAAIGVLLTGMAEDGAAGLRDLKRAGAITIAQDEASSVVFGMPAAAIGLGVVDHVLPPASVAALLVRLAGRGRQEPS